MRVEVCEKEPCLPANEFSNRSLRVSEAVWLIIVTTGDLYVVPRSHKEMIGQRIKVRQSREHREVTKSERKGSWLIRTEIWQLEG